MAEQPVKTWPSVRQSIDGFPTSFRITTEGHFQMNNQSSHTIYVGNIQSIDDDTLREYFQRFGEIEALFHNGARAADEWLIDYRFIRFSSGTDINIFVSHKIDHTICRIRLDIHSYDAAFLDETRFTSDRKICIAHTNPKLDRNLVKKVSREKLGVCLKPISLL